MHRARAWFAALGPRSVLRYVERQAQVVNRGEADMMQEALFGKAPTFNTDVGFSFALSPDEKALTASFGGLEAVIEGASAPPIVTRVFSFSLPLSSVQLGQEIPFFVSGFVFSEREATAHLLFSINDQSTVIDFPANSETDFVHELKYTPREAADVRMTVFLLADRDSNSDSAVHINVTAIDTDMVKHKP